VSLLFWYVGLIHCCATARNRPGPCRVRIFAMGWARPPVHWQRYETAYLLLAGLATPL